MVFKHRKHQRNFFPPMPVSKLVCKLQLFTPRCAGSTSPKQLHTITGLQNRFSGTEVWADIWAAWFSTPWCWYHSSESSIRTKPFSRIQERTKCTLATPLPFIFFPIYFETILNLFLVRTVPYCWKSIHHFTQCFLLISSRQLPPQYLI